MENNQNKIEYTENTTPVSDENENTEQQMSADTSVDENTDLRREYEELIRDKYKKFYTEDTQKMISRRFRKYKEMEERLNMLENERAQFEEILKREKEKSASDAEQRLVNAIRSRRLRPGENGTVYAASPVPRDVSTLTRDERARLAQRVFSGESVKI